MKYLFSIFYFLSGIVLSYSQMIHGYVIEELPDGRKSYITNAVVGVMNTTNATTTDDTGMFMINADPDKDALVVSSLGYKTDTTYLSGNLMLTISLQALVMKDVEVNARKATKL